MKNVYKHFMKQRRKNRSTHFNTSMRDSRDKICEQ